MLPCLYGIRFSTLGAAESVPTMACELVKMYDFGRQVSNPAFTIYLAGVFGPVLHHLPTLQVPLVRNGYNPHLQNSCELPAT